MEKGVPQATTHRIFHEVEFDKRKRDSGCQGEALRGDIETAISAKRRPEIDESTTLQCLGQRMFKALQE